MLLDIPASYEPLTSTCHGLLDFSRGTRRVFAQAEFCANIRHVLGIKNIIAKLIMRDIWDLWARPHRYDYFSYYFSYYIIISICKAHSDAGAVSEFLRGLWHLVCLSVCLMRVCQPVRRSLALSSLTLSLLPRGVSSGAYILIYACT